MPRKNTTRRTSAIKADKMHDVLSLQKPIFLQGGQCEPNYETNEEETNVLEPKQIEANIESGDGRIEKCEECRSEIRCQTPVDEKNHQELWVVRKQLCRGCHSDGAFWSLQTTTEGVSYGDLLQTYLNIQLCPVSKDEPALNAICALCAARLRDARAFSAQARAAEEHFTRLYKQNRVRVLATEEVIEDNVVIVKTEVLANEEVVEVTIVKTEDESNEVSDVSESETKPVNSNLNDGNEESDVGEQETKPINLKLDGEISTEKSISSPLKTKVRRRYTTRKKRFEIPIKMETTEESKCRKRAAKATTSRAKKSKINADDKCFEIPIKMETTEESKCRKRAAKATSTTSRAKKSKINTDDKSDHKVSTDKLASNPNKSKKRQVGGDKPVSKQILYRVLPTDYEHIKGGFKCTHCDNLYNTLDSIGHHIKQEHKQHSRNKPGEPFKLSPSDFIYIEDSFKCTRCDHFKKFTTSVQIRQHVKRMHLKPPCYACSHCSKSFQNITPFIKHKLEEHSIDDRIKCNACDWFSYGRKNALIDHKTEFHMLGEKLTCPDCDYVCFRKKTMKKHSVKHSTVKEHHCKYCKKSFLRKTTLDFHERIHTGDKRKVCNVCGQAFVQRASLKYHMAKHHPEVTDQITCAWNKNITPRNKHNTI